MTTIIDGKKLKEEILNELKSKVYNLKLTLAVIQVGNDEASNVYINQKRKMCEYLNINFKHYKLDNNVTNEEIISLINKLNSDDTTGILLQLPIPKHLDEQKIIDSIDYRKDVDGLTRINVAKLTLNEESLVPCTPKGIMTILRKYKINLEGKKVTIIGRSNLVGKPLSTLMLRENATVSICHSKTLNLTDFTLNSDVIVLAVGHPRLINGDMVDNNVIIIDAGITKVDDKLLGDADYESILSKASYITPVPGGVGPMTIASLAQNIYEAFLLQNK